VAFFGGFQWHIESSFQTFVSSIRKEIYNIIVYMNNEQKSAIAKKIKNITEGQAIKSYYNLKKRDLTTITAETRIGNVFVDYFTFEQRLETISKKGVSFFDFVLNTDYHTKPYIQKLLAYQGDTDKHVALYRVFSLHCSAIGLFKPITAMEIYSRFKPTSILDPTMGWGGRLTGACILDVPNYIGIDLNTQLKQPYDKMTDMLVNKLGTKTKIQLLFQDALTVDYSLFDYDMVLTSPPYYNIEIYQGSTRKLYDEWNEFYKKLFFETYKHMKDGGYFCLNLNIEIYESVCIELLGDADIIITLKKKGHPKNHFCKTTYKEFIYVWVKK